MSARETTLARAMVGAYVLLNSLGALAIKHVIHQNGAPQSYSVGAAVRFLGGMLLSPLVLAGLVAIGLSACAWILALARMELSVAYPVAVALNCLIVVSAGATLYGESLDWSKLTGIGLLFLGLVLLFRSQGGSS